MMLFFTLRGFQMLLWKGGCWDVLWTGVLFVTCSKNAVFCLYMVACRTIIYVYDLDIDYWLGQSFVEHFLSFPSPLPFFFFLSKSDYSTLKVRLVGRFQKAWWPHFLKVRTLIDIGVCAFARSESLEKPTRKVLIEKTDLLVKAKS